VKNYSFYLFAIYVLSETKAGKLGQAVVHADEWHS